MNQKNLERDGELGLVDIGVEGEKKILQLSFASSASITSLRNDHSGLNRLASRLLLRTVRKYSKPGYMECIWVIRINAETWPRPANQKARL